jgi:hypothetical protein
MHQGRNATGAGGAADAAVWPPLSLPAWRDTYATLHMWSQVVGKTRLALSPSENHWWHIALYVTPRGLTTSAMPYGSRTVAVEFDFLDHHVYVRTSDGAVRALALAPQTVAEFYAAYREALRSLELYVPIYPVPVEVETAIPFAEDRTHRAYDADAAQGWWRALVQADRVLKRFRGRFLGKQSPVHFFWGSFDLAVTRFSGRTAPRHPGGAPNCPNYVMEEAYSRECASCGFWPGGGAFAEAAFYAYAYPEPAGYSTHPVGPDGAFYHPEARELILPYEAVRRSREPDQTLLQFLQSAYEGAADLALWDRGTLDRLPGEWP